MSEPTVHRNNWVETTDEEGNIHLFEVVDDFELGEQHYALLIYQGTGDDQQSEDDDEGYDEEVVVMRVALEDGAQVYEAIEDKGEFERVVKHIEEMANKEELSCDIQLPPGDNDGNNSEYEFHDED